MGKFKVNNNSNKIKRQKKHICLELAIKSKSERWFTSYLFFEYLKTQFQTSRIYNYTAQRLYTELKSRGYEGSQRTVERHVKVLRSKGLAYKKDFHLYLISELKCYELTGCNHKTHPSKYLADYILKKHPESFTLQDLIKDMDGINDPEGRKYTPSRIKNNIRHLSVKGFLECDQDWQLYELRKEVYSKQSFRLINQHKHSVRLHKYDDFKTIKEKIVTAIIKLTCERKRYIVNTVFHNNRLARATGRKKSQSEVKDEKEQSISIRELARFTNYSKNTIEKYILNAIDKGWMRRVKQHPEQLTDCFGAVKMLPHVFKKRKAELIHQTKSYVYLKNGKVYFLKPGSLIFKQLIFS